MITDERYAVRLARRVTRMLVRSPIFAILVLIVVVLVVGLAAVTRSWFLPVGLVVGALLAGWLMLFVAPARRVAAAIPAGSRLRSGFGADAFVVADDRTSSTISYSALESIERDGEFVVVRMRQPQNVIVYAAGLFPDSAIDLMNSRLRAPHSE
jgi:hypothetical protein